MNPDNQPPQPGDQADTAIDYSQPVAYDTNGRPLYAHPPAQSTPQQAPSSPSPQIVQMTRPLDPAAPHISESVMEKHRASVKRYPQLNLSEGEYVISAVKRHPIGLAPIFGTIGAGIISLAVMVGMYSNYVADNAGASLPSVGAIGLIAVLFSVLLAIGGFMAMYVYTHNKFFLTNESVIQEIQQSLFSKHEQTVSLANIEDASYQQEGFIQHMFNYGSIRLSTEGDETTYRFSFVANPKQHIAVLNNAVEAFKNGRPIGD